MTQQQHPYTQDVARFRYIKDALIRYKDKIRVPGVRDLTPEQRKTAIKDGIEIYSLSIQDAEKIALDIESNPELITEIIEQDSQNYIGQESDKKHEVEFSEEHEIGILDDFFTNNKDGEPSFVRFELYLENLIGDEEFKKTDKGRTAHDLYSRVKHNREQYIEKHSDYIVNSIKNNFQTGKDADDNETRRLIEFLRFSPAFPLFYAIDKSDKSIGQMKPGSMIIYTRIGDEFHAIRTVQLDDEQKIGRIDQQPLSLSPEQMSGSINHQKTVTISNSEKQNYQGKAITMIEKELGHDLSTTWDPNQKHAASGDNRAKLLDIMYDTRRFRETEQQTDKQDDKEQLQEFI
ncbi:MAG: hypothetical protein FWE16_03725 [Firmicutes bacterium]|nr:hypothetical protein [Bacillota bacterium]